MTMMRIGETKIESGSVISGEHLVRELVKAEGRRVDYVKDGNPNSISSDKNIRLAGVCLALGKYKEAHRFYLASKLIYKIPPELNSYMNAKKRTFLFRAKRMHELMLYEGILDKNYNRTGALERKRKEHLASLDKNFPSKPDDLAILPLVYNAALDKGKVFSEDEMMNYFGLTHFELKYHLAKSEIKTERKISESPGIDSKLREYFERKKENRIKRALALKSTDIIRRAIDKKSILPPLDSDELQFMYTAKIAGEYAFSEDEISGFFGAGRLEARLWLDIGIEPERTMALSREEEKAILDLASRGFDVQSIEFIIQANGEEIANVLSKSKIQLSTGEKISRERAKVINEINKGKVCPLKTQNTLESMKAGKARREYFLQGA